MLDSLFATPKGALTTLLLLNVPWIAVLVAVIYYKTKVNPIDPNVSKKNLVRTEAAWLLLVIAVWTVLNVASIPWMPVNAQQPGSGPVQEVNVTAQMWSYTISDTELEAGTPVHFTARSVDTTHSFAVYDPDGNLIFTSMLVPGTTQEITQTFDEEGEYTVRCLEYCGPGHGAMTDTLRVT